MVASISSPAMSDLAKNARQAALHLGTLSTADRNQAIAAMAEGLTAAAPEIIAANQADCEQKSNGL